MSIVHEAICDGCGKREPARLPGADCNSDPRYWEAYRHPVGWILLWENQSEYAGATPVEGYCTRSCAVLKDQSTAPQRLGDFVADFFGTVVAVGCCHCAGTGRDGKDRCEHCGGTGRKE